jgi:hypothetical protein
LDNGSQGTASLWTQIGFKVEGSFLLMADGADCMLSTRQPSSIQSSVFNAALLKASSGFDRRVVPMEDTELFCRFGIGGSVCAVNAVGCVYSADDNAQNRLTKINNNVENYWNCKRMLWSIVHSRLPELIPAYQLIIRCKLAEAFWRLARNHWKTGRRFQGIVAFLQCIKTCPSFPIIVVRDRKSGGWRNNVGQLVPNGG